jgi:hypothetical protein
MEQPDVKDGMRMDNRHTSFGYDELLAWPGRIVR